MKYLAAQPVIRVRSSATVLAMIGLLAPGAVAGQSQLIPILDSSATPLPSSSHTVKPSDFAGGFGLSRAIRVILAEQRTTLPDGVLGGVLAGWDLGHRWIRFDPAMTPSVLGEPAARTATSPGSTPRVLGVPAEPASPSPAEFSTSPPVLGVPAEPISASAAAPSASPRVLGVPAESVVTLSAGSSAPSPRVLGVPAVAPSNATPPDAAIGPIVAPAESGVWRLESGSGLALTVITPIPATQARGGRLNGYHIGTYPTAGSDRTDAYAPPAWFIEVTPANRDLAISRHLTLGQFLTKDQFEVWPKYVALDFRLIDKLELVMQELHLMGVRADRMHVMSGFRTPQYNGPGGDGRAALSRHMWGDAADVWIDNLGTGEMSDLNGDGLVDMDDAAVIMRAVDRVERKFPELIGGAGAYPNAPTHGPYIHIDARGNFSRW